MKVLIIDNYDSFTFNLFQYTGEVLAAAGITAEIDVIRNDEITLSEIRNRKYDRIIISPGPGSPDDPAYFGVNSEVLTELTNIPILGVCLGMQGMAHVYGGRVVRAAEPRHGKVSPIDHDGKGVFAGLPRPLDVMRYHSLVVDPDTLPAEFEITARIPDGPREIMGIRHRILPLEGIQFHPESFATEGGKTILRNFLLR